MKLSDYLPSSCEIEKWATDMWMFPRSLTGPGVRQTLKYIQSIIPEIEIRSCKSGLRCETWTIPPEWEVDEAFIITPRGDKICDFSTNRLHLLGFSEPFEGKMNLAELKQHLYYSIDRPNAIPYVTSYYQPRWGFCISYSQFLTLEEGEYNVILRSQKRPGNFQWGELYIPGTKSNKEFLMSTYICHPQMANNELSGPLCLLAMASCLLKSGIRLPFGVRFLWQAETIGAIRFIHTETTRLSDIFAGIVATCVGVGQEFTHIESPYGNNLGDQLIRESLLLKKIDPVTESFLERGSDERQYCWPTVNLPVSSLCRRKYHKYAEYHTSEDNLDLLDCDILLETADIYLNILELAADCVMPMATTRGEPFLSAFSLMPTISYGRNSDRSSAEVLDILAYSNGRNTIQEISRHTGIPHERIRELVKILEQKELIKTLRPWQ